MFFDMCTAYVVQDADNVVTVLYECLHYVGNILKNNPFLLQRFYHLHRKENEFVVEEQIRHLPLFFRLLRIALIPFDHIPCKEMWSKQ